MVSNVTVGKSICLCAKLFSILLTIKLLSFDKDWSLFITTGTIPVGILFHNVVMSCFVRCCFAVRQNINSLNEEALSLKTRNTIQ